MKKWIRNWLGFRVTELDASEFEHTIKLAVERYLQKHFNEEILEKKLEAKIKFSIWKVETNLQQQLFHECMKQLNQETVLDSIVKRIKDKQLS